MDCASSPNDAAFRDSQTEGGFLASCQFTNSSERLDVLYGAENIANMEVYVRAENYRG